MQALNVRFDQKDTSGRSRSRDRRRRRRLRECRRPDRDPTRRSPSRPRHARADLRRGQLPVPALRRSARHVALRRRARRHLDRHPCRRTFRRTPERPALRAARHARALPAIAAGPLGQCVPRRRRHRARRRIRRTRRSRLPTRARAARCRARDLRGRRPAGRCRHAAHRGRRPRPPGRARGRNVAHERRVAACAPCVVRRPARPRPRYGRHQQPGVQRALRTRHRRHRRARLYGERFPDHRRELATRGGCGRAVQRPGPLRRLSGAGMVRQLDRGRRPQCRIFGDARPDFVQRARRAQPHAGLERGHEGQCDRFRPLARRGTVGCVCGRCRASSGDAARGWPPLYPRLAPSRAERLVEIASSWGTSAGFTRT